MPEVITVGDDEYVVATVSQFGHPRRVYHQEPCMRGSFREYSVNLGLAVHNLKLALRASVPHAIRRFVPEPRPFWSVVMTAID